MQEKRVLRAEKLFKSYSGKQIIKDVSFEIHSGQIVGLLGPNGAGKTTSFYMAVGLIQPDLGSIYLDQTIINKWPMHKRARNGIAYLPQEASIFRKMTVEENILCVLETLSLTSSQQSDRLHQLLDDFNINTIAKQKGYTLSGGERRRIEIARALALNPTFLLLDEPFAGIDPIAMGDIQKMIQILKYKNIGILITDHNARETLQICDLGYLLNNGTIIEVGTSKEIVESPKARESYLGKNFQL